MRDGARRGLDEIPDELPALRVCVGGIVYPAEIVRGTLRFRENAVVRMLVDRGLIDLNQVMIYGSRLPRRDLAEFWMMLGYSVDGFCDIFTDLEVITPDWQRDGKLYSDGLRGISDED